MKTLRISDNEVAIIAEDGSLSGGVRKSGTHIIFNNLQDAKRAWELFTSDALEYREPEPAVRPADLEMLSQRIDQLEIDVKFEAINEEDNQEDFAELRKELEDLRKELEWHDLHADHADDAHIHDLIAQFVIDDDAGTLRRKVLSIVADKLLGR